MKFGEIVFYLIVALFIISLAYKFFFSKTQKEKEYERKLKESLADEFIYDPETGAKLTLEQAESGNWIAHNNLNRIKPKEELEQYYKGKEKEIEELANFLKSNGYKFTKLTDSQIEFLEQTKILSKYDDWSYSCSYSFNEGKDFVFFPRVTFNNNRHENGYSESQIMFWINDMSLDGHVYLREKTNFEAFTDMIRNDDLIELDHFETFVFKESTTMIPLLKTLRLLDMQKDLEIEIIEDSLLIKSLKYVNKNDYLRIEETVKGIRLAG
ncbi:hypothetical protein SAMN05444397_10153 [Flavobacterium aquidurense]|uniref:DUF4340 domain-containing protein n=1 Tax=Flavobacterium frigidimaris TaxID=262320 RepID=A0ABX4BKU2_FLAFR|nr:hypothetical protein [Flavobacterium frigidimaris]OXA76330.1 hypothetical protein B0A65_19315 [Flavobacterium frigidimaris]SDY21216.1 hypothetical protein SAMN05444397_10153 [Flavobacterium aquidurense]